MDVQRAREIRKALQAVFCVTCLTLAPAALGQSSVADHMRALCEKREFLKAYRLVNEALNESGKSPEERAALVFAKAEFYEHHVGDPKEALRLCESLDSLDLPERHPVSVSAASAVGRLRPLARRYNEHKELLEGECQRAAYRAELREQVVVIRTFIERANTRDATDGSIRALAHYYFGVYLLRLGEYRKAYGAFRRTLSMRPAFALCQPAGAVIANFRGAYASYMDVLLRALIRWTALFLLVFIAIVCGFSRPWTWFTVRHFFSFVFVGTLSVVVLLCALWLTGELAVVAPDILPDPVFVGRTFGSYASKAPITLLYYLSGGVVTILIAALALGRIRYTWTRRFAVVVAALVLFACTIGLFFFQTARTPSDHAEHYFVADRASVCPYLSGTSYFRAKDVKPFVLCSPRAYPGLDITRINEPVFAAWLKRQYARIHPLAAWKWKNERKGAAE